jgi:hypothetical protein
VNTVLAVLAARIAIKKKLIVPLWAVKTFLVGGLAFFEVSRAIPVKEIPRTPRF